MSTLSPDQYAWLRQFREPLASNPEWQGLSFAEQGERIFAAVENHYRQMAIPLDENMTTWDWARIAERMSR